MERQETLERAVGLSLGAAALGLILLAPFAAHLAAFVPPCPFRAMTGAACPLCGTTRAALALARLEPMEALVHHPLPTLLWIVALAWALWAGIRALRGRPLPTPRFSARGWTVLAVAVAANWIYSLATGV